MKFKDADKAKQILDTAVPYLERLGVCVTAFVGGGAIVKYSDQVFPLIPWIPSFVGFLLVFASLFLALLVAAETWRALTASVKSRWVNLLVLIVILVTSIFFVIAGGIAAVKALAAP